MPKIGGGHILFKTLFKFINPGIKVCSKIGHYFRRALKIESEGLLLFSFLGLE